VGDPVGSPSVVEVDRILAGIAEEGILAEEDTLAEGTGLVEDRMIEVGIEADLRNTGCSTYWRMLGGVIDCWSYCAIVCAIWSRSECSKVGRSDEDCLTHSNRT